MKLSLIGNLRLWSSIGECTKYKDCGILKYFQVLPDNFHHVHDNHHRGRPLLSSAPGGWIAQRARGRSGQQSVRGLECSVTQQDCNLEMFVTASTQIAAFTFPSHKLLSVLIWNRWNEKVLNKIYLNQSEKVKYFAKKNVSLHEAAFYVGF